MDIWAMREVNWRTSECVIGSAEGRYFLRDQDWNFPVSFSNTSDLLFRKAQYLLSLDRGRSYAAIRWERFDFANRCKSFWLKGVAPEGEKYEELRISCASAKALVSIIKEGTNEKAVYVSTNEIDQESLDIISLHGMKLLKKSALILDELQSIIVDLQMLGSASTFLSWEIGINLSF
jgi:hypothetical protein